jgi:PKD repeat protein
MSQDAQDLREPVGQVLPATREWGADAALLSEAPLLWATFDGLPSQDPISPAAFHSELGGSSSVTSSYDDTAIVDDPSGPGKVIRTTLEANTIRGKPAGNHGVALFPPLARGVDEACISYDVRFGPGFDFSLGGKLPGLLGVRAGVSPGVPTGGGNPGDKGWSARAMWLGAAPHGEANREGTGVSYLYGPQMRSYYGEQLPWDRVYEPGEWHKVKHCQHMNSVGSADGVERAYFDGRLVDQDTQYVFRTREDVHINYLAWSIFRGGNDLAWASREPGYIDIDNVLVTENANVSPMADFSALVHDRTLELHGRGYDVDGQVESFSWDFGDGTTGSGPELTHTYRTPGTYPVTLTVTDFEGGTDTVTKRVTVAGSGKSYGPLLQDNFNRPGVSSWGSTQVGGSWLLRGGQTNFDVSDGRGGIVIHSGQGPKAIASSALGTSTDARVSLALDRLPDEGSVYLALTSRTSEDGDSGYRAKVRVQSDGAVGLSLVRVVDKTETTLAAAEGVTSLSRDQGDGWGEPVPDAFLVRLQTEGSAPTEVRAKVWPAGTPEPEEWVVAASDRTYGLQVPGRAGIWSYLSRTATNGPVVAYVDSVLVTVPY